MADWSGIVLCGYCGKGNPCDVSHCLTCGKKLGRTIADSARRTVTYIRLHLIALAAICLSVFPRRFADPLCRMIGLSRDGCLGTTDADKQKRTGEPSKVQRARVPPESMMRFTALVQSDAFRDGGSYFVRVQDETGGTFDLFLGVIIGKGFKKTGYNKLVRKSHYDDQSDLEVYDWPPAQHLFAVLETLPRQTADFNESRFVEMRGLIDKEGRPTITC